jgi:hypothetical protein
MLDAIKPLLESGLINEDIGQQLNEAWETKLNEAREQVRVELREEFAQRYEHDRTIMVEALDKMITENLKEEIQEFHEERKAMNEERVKAQMTLRENASKFNDFMLTKLAEEIKELRSDRKVQMENQTKLEKFVIQALAKEITEFSQDKKAVVEAKVKLVSEGQKQIEELKEKFISESAVKVNQLVTSHLKKEMSQLKEDIKLARENNFGRKLFEAFASEFSVTYLNDKAETRKLMQQLSEKDKLVAEAKAEAAKAAKLLESKNREVRLIKESTERERTMAKLLSPLNEEKKEVMKTLLESVQTPRLQNAFDKYLPAVLNTVNNGSVKSASKTVIVENTGDKTAKKPIHEDNTPEKDNVVELKRLAGL